MVSKRYLTCAVVILYNFSCRKEMKYSVLNNHYQILTSLDRDDEAEKVFVEAEQLLTESGHNEQLLVMYDLKV